MLGKSTSLETEDPHSRFGYFIKDVQHLFIEFIICERKEIAYTIVPCSCFLVDIIEPLKLFLVKLVRTEILLPFFFWNCYQQESESNSTKPTTRGPTMIL